MLCNINFINWKFVFGQLLLSLSSNPGGSVFSINGAMFVRNMCLWVDAEAVCGSSTCDCLFNE